MDNNDMVTSYSPDNNGLVVFIGFASIFLLYILLYLFAYVLAKKEEKEKIQLMRRNALAALKGHWGITIAVSIVFLVLIGNYVSFFFLPVYIGYHFYILELSKGQAGFAKLFKSFNLYWRNIGLVLLTGLFEFLWFLLLFVPGIIKMLAYSQTFFIRSEMPELGAIDTISLSQDMMKGNKLKLFRLLLSFIPWFLLALLTFGVLLIYVGPYFMTSLAEFYKVVKAEYDTRETIVTM